jgi:hypothetical protein
MVANMGFNLIFIWPLGYIGLALSTALSGTVNAISLFQGLYRRHVYRPGWSTGWFFLRLVLAAVGMYALLWWLSPTLEVWVQWHFLRAALELTKLLAIGVSEWAATEQLVELGGQVVEGLLIVQNYDRDDQTTRFQEFSEAYFKRYQKNPGYSSVSAYDAATVVLTALKNRKKGESLKTVAQRSGPYQGLQQTIAFDANGDTERKVFFTEIQGGRYVKLK